MFQWYFLHNLLRTAIKLKYDSCDVDTGGCLSFCFLTSQAVRLLFSSVVEEWRAKPGIGIDKWPHRDHCPPPPLPADSPADEDVHPMWIWCWTSVVDAGPTSNPHRVNVFRWLCAILNPGQAVLWKRGTVEEVSRQNSRSLEVQFLTDLNRLHSLPVPLHSLF